MEDWKEVKLGDCIKTNLQSINRDYPYSTIKYLDTGSITENRIDSLKEFSINEAPSRAKRIVQDEDIIYSTVRPNQLHYGFVQNPKKNLIVSTGFVTITCNQAKIFSKFLFYYLTQSRTTEYLHSIAEASTSAYPSLKPSDIESLEIPLPPLPEQRAIACVLSSLDDKIDLLHRQNQTLEAMAETLFRQWFVEEAEEEWEDRVLEDEFEIIMGQSPPGSSYNEEGKGTPMYQGNKDFGFRFPTNRVFTIQPKRFAQKYDTLISVRAPVGAQNMAIEECCIGRGVSAFRHKMNPDNYTYTFYKLKSLMDEIKQYNQTGTVFGSISKSDFQRMEVIIPNKKNIQDFQDKAKPLDEKITNNSDQIRTLTQLRDTLLPKLMSGEVRVDQSVKC